MNANRISRCAWAGTDPLMIQYHDTEWGVPLHEDRKIFEFLALEGMQAGLSWATILRKRENFRHAFDGFDPRVVATFDGRKIETLLLDSGIIRNRLKIEAAVVNARKFLEIQKEFGSFDKYSWHFVGGRPVRHRLKTPADIPTTSTESDLLSKDMRSRGFKFAGSTIIYAHMQATGMVNDHLVSCFRYKEV